MHIPASNIIEIGYTQGYRYKNPDGSFYHGPYHVDDKKRYWTGKEHTPSSVILKDTVVDISFTKDYIAKHGIISNGFTKHYNQNLDTPYLTNDIIKPSISDYDNGYFTRYIAQLRATIDPMLSTFEVNSDNFKKYFQSANFKKYYKYTSFTWLLVGPLDDVFEDNILMFPGIRDTNLKSLQRAGKTITDISKVITDPLQFAIKPRVPNLYN
jgi:hypothetical protein